MANHLDRFGFKVGTVDGLVLTQTHITIEDASGNCLGYREIATGKETRWKTPIAAVNEPAPASKVVVFDNNEFSPAVDLTQLAAEGISEA